MAGGFRKRATREARQLQAQIKAQTLRELREKVRTVRKRKREGLRAVRQQCRAARVRLRQKIAAFKVSERQRIREEVARMRADARGRCKARIARVHELGGRAVELRRKELDQRKRLERELERVDAKARRTNAARARRQAEESDDEVRSNLPEELVPVFNRVRRSIRPHPRRSRTETFLQWAEENPAEVVEIQILESDAKTARLIRELEEQEAAAHHGRTGTNGNDDDPPF